MYPMRCGFVISMHFQLAACNVTYMEVKAYRVLFIYIDS